MPIFQILVVGSIIVAIVLGVQAFTRGIKFTRNSPEPIKGLPARIIGSLCLLYAAVASGAIVWFFVYILLDS